jgi:L-lactate dehydrogenase complex protein LldF
VVERLTDVPPLVELLTGSATGQSITTYIKMITSPRKNCEKDGPEEIHLIILDNKRSKILSDLQLRQTLQCIRCGACLNHCPVYTRIGGHAYGFVYPGPIGTILTPQMEGLDKTGDLINASSLCNACEEVCPVKIPIPDLIRRLRNESVSAKGCVEGAGSRKSLAEMAIWKGWEIVNRHAALNKIVVKTAALSRNQLKKLWLLKAWTSTRTLPEFSEKSMLNRVKEKGVTDE